MNLSSVITNTNGWGTGFQQLGAWPYNTPASYYFWAGFTVVMAFGLVALGMRWVSYAIGHRGGE